MSALSRLATAIDDGALTLPAGEVAVLRPGATYDMAPLAGLPVTVVQTYAPDAARWASVGLPVVRDLPAVAVAVVVVPRAKALARAMIADACAHAALVVVDGQRTDGVDALFKECRARLGDLPSIPKDHGRLFWFAATDAFADWTAPPPQMGDHGYFTTPGVFSEDGIDRGSAALVAALPAKMPGRMADFGAGWGYLAGAVLARDGVQSVDLIEAEALAIDCARLNLSDPRAAFHWADATTHAPAVPYQGIVMNPPFHTGRTADPALGRAFITAAARALTPQGQLWMVANRHLPYEATLRAAFKVVTEVGHDPAFKVFHATRPQR